MNCRDVTGILDDGKIDSLDVTQRQQVEAHVAVCADCARAWHLQASLAALPDMALPANFPARCRALVAAGPKSTASRRAGSRVLLWGSLTALALAAAAATLAPLLRPAARTARIAETEAIPPAIDAVSAEHPAGSPPAFAMEPSPAPPFTLRVDPAPPVVNGAQSASTTPAVVKAINRLPGGGTPDDLRNDFAAELVDPVWALTAGSQILHDLDTKATDKQIGILSRDVQCRAETCRVLITYPDQVSDRRDLMRVGGPVSQVVWDITHAEGASVTGALILHRGGFAGEPTTSEVFLARSGYAGVMDFWRTPGESASPDK